MQKPHWNNLVHSIVLCRICERLLAEHVKKYGVQSDNNLLGFYCSSLDEFGIPLVYSLQSKRPLQHFGLLFVFNQYAVLKESEKAIKNNRIQDHVIISNGMIWFAKECKTLTLYQVDPEQYGGELNYALERPPCISAFGKSEPFHIEC